MGTRGTFGVRVDGQDKLMYNRFDSYPSDLGVSLVEQLRKLVKTPTNLKKKAQALTSVDENVPPTAKQVKALAPYTDLEVGHQSTADWYCLTWKMQGRLDSMLDAGLYLDSGDFITDSLFCEWAYIVNLDDGILEIYQGFQYDAHTKGRYGQCKRKKTYEGQQDYYGCALVKTFKLNRLPKTDNWAVELDR